MLIILPAILRNQHYCWQCCQQYCQQYCRSAILSAILLNQPYCWISNTAESAILLAIFSVILLAILLNNQQYCWQYCWVINNFAGKIADFCFKYIYIYILICFRWWWFQALCFMSVENWGKNGLVAPLPPPAVLGHDSTQQ